MKKLIAILIALLIFSSSQAFAEEYGFMTHEKITISFTYGDRSGYYTGSTVNGVPDGYGCFETKNSSGNLWIYVGEFKNGIFNGEGLCVWPELSESGQGIFENGDLIDGVSRYAEITKTLEGKFTGSERNTLVGKATYPDGSVFFDGKIVNGICEEGTIYNTDGTVAAVGKFGEGFSRFIDTISLSNLFD